MKQRTVALVIAAVVIVAAIAAWLSSTRHAHRAAVIADANTALVVALESEIETLDPANLKDPVTSRAVWQLFEGLVELDRSGQPAPCLAVSWKSSADFRDWTFRIRPDVRYHQDVSFAGLDRTRTVRAEDVRASYERYAKGFGSFLFGGVVKGFDEYVQGKAKEISGIEVLNSNEVRFSLTRPDPSFIYRLTSPYLSIMPPEAIEHYGNQWGVTAAVGTGPYRLETASRTHAVLSRNPQYWRPVKGNIAKLEFRVEKNAELLFGRLERGDYHAAVVPGNRIARYVESGRLRAEFVQSLQLDAFPTYNTHYLVFDVKHVPDVNLRRAAAKAIDKADIVRHLLYGTGRPLESIVPPAMLGYVPPPFSSRKDEHQPPTPAAREQLSFVVSDQQGGPEIAQVVQAQLSRAGIETRIEVLGVGPFISRVFSDHRPDLFLVSAEWVFGAPELLMAAYDSRATPNPNLSGYANPDADKLIDSLTQGNHRAQLNAICQQIESKTLDDAPIIPLFNRDQLLLSNKRLSGVSINPQNQWILADARWSER